MLLMHTTGSSSIISKLVRQVMHHFNRFFLETKVLSEFFFIFLAQKTLLVGVDEEIEGKKSTFMNDLAVAKDGTVYFTVSSTAFPLFDGLYALFASGHGRYVLLITVIKVFQNNLHLNFFLTNFLFQNC